MEARYVALYFRYPETDWWCRRHPELKEIPFVLAEAQHGRKVITAITPAAEKENITVGMTVAGAKACFPDLQSFDAIPGHVEKLFTAIGHWCDRFTPVVATDVPDGLLLNVTGCAHLWGGERQYLTEICSRLQEFGYHVRGAMADTPGAAWAAARYSSRQIIPRGKQAVALMDLPPTALRLSPPVIDRLYKLGFREIKGFMHIQRSMLRRRFGPELLLRMDQALGAVEEILVPLAAPAEYRERLPCLEPISTRGGIEAAIRQLLERLCERLQKAGKGIRNAVLKGCRIDGQKVQIQLTTVRPSVNVLHLFRLFELKIQQLEPGLGIELFTLEATQTEDTDAFQETMFEIKGDLADKEIAELVDRISGKLNGVQIRRYLPSAHYWPEQSLQATRSLTDMPVIQWPEKQRPVELLHNPHLIEVTAPIPDYPPMLFKYRGELHRIKKADGPECIERAWWMDSGNHRDYYAVEDEKGRRYWVFRSGHYDNSQPPGWFLHGFFA